MRVLLSHPQYDTLATTTTTLVTTITYDHHHTNIPPPFSPTRIVKVIPPKEWKEAVPTIDPKLLHSVCIKNAIRQHITGSHGIYTQMNVPRRKPYSVMDWKELCSSQQYRPPAFVEDSDTVRKTRFPRKQTVSVQSPAPPPSSSPSTTAKAAASTVTRKSKKQRVDLIVADIVAASIEHTTTTGTATSSTPTSPTASGAASPAATTISGTMTPTGNPELTESAATTEPSTPNVELNDPMDSLPIMDEEQQHGDEEPQRNDEKQQHNEEEQRQYSLEDLLPEERFPSSTKYFKELERQYWKTVTFNPPWYGADVYVLEQASCGRLIIPFHLFVIFLLNICP